ncbi:MAG: DUF1573 domain-containing protein [Bacteroidales bacterium]|nr:DUF1573 domain-containing protein [Bacteroidales bacterium]
MKTVFWTIALAASLLSCGSRTANSAPVVELVATETIGLPEVPDEGDAVFDKLVHDFGDVSVEDGPLTCTFTVTNNGKEPIALFEVVSSCGCTDVTWTREPLQPGKSGTISATFKNEDGPFPFDKTLTVYISGQRKPVILRLRGVVHEKKKSLSELYGAQKLGDFGLKAREYKAGILKQGLTVSEMATVANLGKKPLEVSFTEVSEHLKVSVTPNPIPAGSTASLIFTIEAAPELYGKQTYSATPVLNGQKAKAPLTVWASTRENFDRWTEQQRNDGAIPVFENSTANFGTVKAGTPVELTFNCSNRGKSTFHIYQADPEDPALKVLEIRDAEAGGKGFVRVQLNTSAVEKGETVIMLTLITNSPLRPVVNLFVAGQVL